MFYKHDCEDCLALGTVEIDNIKNGQVNKTDTYDMYFCANCDGGTYIVRYGNDGPDYSSCPFKLFNKFTHPLILLARSMHEKLLATPVATTAPEAHTPVSEKQVVSPGTPIAIPRDMTTLTAVKVFPGGETTACAVPVNDGTYTVKVIHRFDSGNFVKEKDHEFCSIEVAKGLLHYYTE